MATIKVPDWLPKERRDFIQLGFGVALALGLTQIPGLTVEPSHCTECARDLGMCEARLDDCGADEADLRRRIEVCWTRHRETVGASAGPLLDPTPVPD